jgi:hypothetical protein
MTEVSEREARNFCPSLSLTSGAFFAFLAPQRQTPRNTSLLRKCTKVLLLPKEQQSRKEEEEGSRTQSFRAAYFPTEGVAYAILLLLTSSPYSFAKGVMKKEAGRNEKRSTTKGIGDLDLILPRRGVTSPPLLCCYEVSRDRGQGLHKLLQTPLVGARGFLRKGKEGRREGGVQKRQNRVLSSTPKGAWAQVA